MAFATAAELASVLQQSFTAEETATAELLLDLASAAIRMATGQQIDRVTDDAVTFLAPNGTDLLLLQRPAEEPTVVEVGGVAVTDWSFDGLGTLYRPYGWRAYDSTTGALMRVSVTYTHGYTTIPDAIKGLCLELAANAYRNPTGLRSSQRAVDDYSETDTYATDTVGGGLVLSREQAAAARRALGLQSAYSVPL